MAEKYKKLTSASFFSYPRLYFTNFTISKVLCETEAMMMSPTSILDSNKPFYGFKNPFWSETNSPRSTTTVGGEHKRCCWDKLDSKGLVDALVDDDDNKPSDSGEMKSKSQSRMVLFGSQLKIQIPPNQLHATTVLSPPQSPKSEADLGVKVRNSQLGQKPALEAETSKSKSFTGCLSASEMEHSEDYTRVISHGPNPRTTHIFDNCIVESGCFDVGCCSSSATESVSHINYPSESFMSFCFYCNKNLGHGIDIYIYR